MWVFTKKYSSFLAMGILKFKLDLIKNCYLQQLKDILSVMHTTILKQAFILKWCKAFYENKTNESKMKNDWM